MIPLIEFIEHAFKRLVETAEGITEEELHWRPVPEMNTVDKIIRHVARISLVLLPQVVEGTTTGAWNDDYEHRDHSLTNMLHDIEEGRKIVLNGIRSWKTDDLETVIPLWGSTHRRAEGINMLVGELIYHAGQIALIRGAYRRANLH